MAFRELRGSHPQQPQPIGDGEKRTTFKKWANVAPGDVIEGIWHQPRPVKSKNGTGDYALGEVEHANGTLTVFTIPSSLRRLTADIPVGTRVQIVFKGCAPATVGIQYQFSVFVDDGT